MTKRQQRARAMVDLIERLAAEHGTGATCRDAPKGWRGRFLNINPAWNALLTSRPKLDESAEASDCHDGREAEAHQMLTHAIEIWIYGERALSVEFDDDRSDLRIIKFQTGDWDAELFEWAARSLGFHATTSEETI